VAQEEQHLRVPIVGRQRPTVRENDRLTFAPILVINVSVRFLPSTQDAIGGASFIAAC
jgi:hypothetical protein